MLSAKKQTAMIGELKGRTKFSKAVIKTNAHTIVRTFI